MMQKLKNFFKDRDIRIVVAIFIIYKIFVISIAVGTQFLVPADITHSEKVTDNPFLNPFAQYDSTAYLDIAEHGYRPDFGEYKAPNYHWYPLYPLLIRAFSFIGYPLAAFLIANVASFLAIIVLYLLVKDEIGKSNSRKTVFYLLFFPTAFYFTTMYTESLFLLLSLLVFYYAEKGNWLATGVFGFLVSLTRMQGVLLLIPAGYIYLRSVQFNFRKINKQALYLIAMPLGIATFMLYEYFITGNLFAQFNSAVGFGKTLSFPWTGFIHAVKSIFVDSTLINVTYHIYNLLIASSFVVLLFISYKRLRLEYTIYFALTLLVILVSSNLYGVSRYMLMAFPAFMVLPLIEEKNKYVKYALIAAYVIFILLMAGFIVLHVTERLSAPILYKPLF